MRRFLAGIAALALLAIAAAPAAATATTTGTWSQYPTGASTYSAQILQPINPDGSSNWPSKSKGGIPIMFSLASGTGTAVFQSTSTQPDSYMSFAPSPALTLNQITNLSATYSFSLGDCFGGSLRWTLTDPQLTAGLINVYYGDPRNLVSTGNQSCSGAYDESGKNLMDQSDSSLPIYRFEIGNSGVYVDWATILAATNNGTDLIGAAQLTLDSGWHANQILTAGTTATVNDNTQTWNSGGGASTGTCNLPAATLKVTQTAGATPGNVDETTVQQNFDTGIAFRTVDCKYQYVISIPSLKGAGTYKLEIQIGSITVGTAYVDLK